MRLSLVPDRLFRTYREITPEYLRGEGVKLLLCDLDYTLAPKSVPHPDDEVRRWIDGMGQEGIRVMILSNNRSPARVEAFCRDLGIDYVGHAGKPFARGFRQAMAMAGVTEKETAMLGDKLLTDVLCAHFNDSLALMVEPAGGPKSVLQKVLHAMQEPFKNINRRRKQ
jgi:HAD superfamily phosphatase (TIGR01668 family)